MIGILCFHIYLPLSSSLSLSVFFEVLEATSDSSTTKRSLFQILCLGSLILWGRMVFPTGTLSLLLLAAITGREALPGDIIVSWESCKSRFLWLCGSCGQGQALNIILLEFTCCQTGHMSFSEGQHIWPHGWGRIFWLGSSYKLRGDAMVAIVCLRGWELPYPCFTPSSFDLRKRDAFVVFSYGKSVFFSMSEIQLFTKK